MGGRRRKLGEFKKIPDVKFHPISVGSVDAQKISMERCTKSAQDLSECITFAHRIHSQISRLQSGTL